MNHRKLLSVAMIAAVMAGASAPAFAQNRFMDQARDNAARRAENKAVREAEHPEEEAKPANTTTASTATPAPAETAPAAQSVPAAAAPAATPAPAN